MSDERVSYMYQRDPSIDRRYRPRPKNRRDLFKDIREDEEFSDVNPQSSLASMDSQNSDTTNTTAAVFLRLRPSKNASKHYVAEDNKIKVRPTENLTTNNKDLTERHFEFSKIFDTETSQLDVYKQSVHSSIQNSDSLTVLTYGTSGSGKTYTMYGSPTDAGIVQRAIAHIFTIDEKIICSTPAAKIDKGNFSLISEENIQTEINLTAEYVQEDTAFKHDQIIHQIRTEHDFQPVDHDWQYVFVWMSFAEIYNENVHDLLKTNPAATKRKNLKIISNDGNSYIKDLTAVHVSTAKDAYDVVNYGLQQVNYATTNINKNSSRSHCILVINVIRFSYPDIYSLATYKFCDLAGSERLKKTANVGDRLKEAQRINTSLMVLGRCFEHMYQNQQAKSKESKDVVPFRESKLTMLLQRALIGQERISTIVTMAPLIDYMEENLQVLSFASIARQIVYKQPKQEIDRRAAARARSTRFSWFMNDIERRNDNDWNDMFTENERLETENFDLKAERDSLLDVIQRMTSEHAKQEQTLRNKLVEEREAQMKTANEKWNKRVAFVESRLNRRVCIFCGIFSFSFPC